MRDDPYRDPAAWWRRLEERAPGGDGAAAPGDGAVAQDLPPREALARAHDAELTFRMDEAERWIGHARAGLPDGPWRRAAELLALRVTVRRARIEELEAAHERLRTLLDALESDEEPTRARVHHLEGVLLTRLDRLDEAERALGAALASIGDGPARAWVLDGLGRVLMGQGAWHRPSAASERGSRSMA